MMRSLMLFTHPEIEYWDAYWDRQQNPNFVSKPYQEIHFRLKDSAECLAGAVAVLAGPYDDTTELTFLDTMLLPTQYRSVGRMRGGIWNVLGDLPLRFLIDGDRNSHIAYDGVFHTPTSNKYR